MSTKKRTGHETRQKGNGANKLDLRNEIQEQHGARTKHWFAWVFDALELPKHGEVLDLGCGTGRVWMENSRRIPRGCRVVMADTALNVLRGSLAAIAPRLASARILAANIQSIPFPDGSFDLVTAIGLLDLVPDISRALREVRRVLRPGGKFVATAGAQGHLQELKDLLLLYLPEEQARSIGGYEDRFGMENGERILAPFFESITRQDFSDRMVFNDLQPILNYILSEQAITRSLTLDHLGDLVKRVKRQMAKTGAFSVSIRKGMFIAER